MKNIISTLVLMAVLLSQGIALAATPAEKVTVAVQAAQQWLALVDHEKYAESWDTAAKFFRTAVPKATWTSYLTQYRTPMGQAISRSMDSANFLTQVPGSGPGEYVVIIFKVNMSSGKVMTENVTPMLDPDGIWRVAGYYIK